MIGDGVNQTMIGDGVNQTMIGDGVNQTIIGDGVNQTKSKLSVGTRVYLSISSSCVMHSTFLEIILYE